MTAPVDLTNCDREPIHIPGLIQPHGVLLLLDDQFVIRRISANAGEMLGLSFSGIGQSLMKVIDALDAAEVETQLKSSPLHLHPIYVRSIRRLDHSQSFDAIAHRTRQGVYLELEPSMGPPWADGTHLHRLLQTALIDINAAATLEQVYERIVGHVRSINGFDRVMLYRFDGDWNGQVVSESKRDDLEPFLGLHYPASDIPRQARELYAKNLLRVIADRDYVPAQVLPPSGPDESEPLDMSHCVLRSVSPIHLEYLRNMGVGASMSISLLRDGNLWGLIACHHYSPRKVPYDVRAGCEMLAQNMSLVAVACERTSIEQSVQQRRQHIVRLINDLDPGLNFSASLTDDFSTLIDVMLAGGAAVLDDLAVTRVGQTPSEHDIRIIADAIRQKSEGPIFSTDRLSELIDGGRADPVASGVLMVSLARYAGRRIIWFRPEQIRTVNWAGDPAKSVRKGEDDGRLSPRGSFALWKETVRGRSVPWSEADHAAADEFRRGVLNRLLDHAQHLAEHNIVLRKVTDEKEQLLESERAARSQAERMNRMKDEFVAMLSHELRTPLNAIQGWSQLLRTGNKSVPEFHEGLEVIERNARSQSQMIEDLLDMSRITSGKLRLDVEPVNLPMVAEAAIATVKIAADIKNIRIQATLDPMIGVSVTGDPHRLQQVIWNLLSNAVKFTPKGGRVAVELKRVNSHVELSVTDSGVGIATDFLPHVFDRFRQADSTSSRRHGGLGLGLAIVRHLVEMHGGTVMAFSGGKGQGSTFTVTLPVRALNQQEEVGEHPSRDGGVVLDCKQLQLQNVSALVVDDEPDARELVRRVLQECDMKVTTAGSAAEAMSLLFDRSFDVLISDIGMPGEDGYVLIRQLRELEGRTDRGKMPAVALTAYARAQDRLQIMLAGFQVHVAKPVEAAELLAVVASLTNRV